MIPTTITISGEGMGIIERLRAGMESRELINLFGLKFAGVKLEIYTHGDPHAVMLADEVTEAQPAPWSGDGLPPVGTVCEVFMFGEWVQCEVVAHFMQSTAEVAAFTTMRTHGGKSLDSKIAECFRPIKTTAQIAAEEREKAIDEMHGLTNTSSNQEVIRAQRNVCAALYDAGYRKGDDK